MNFTANDPGIGPKLGSTGDKDENGKVDRDEQTSVADEVQDDEDYDDSEEDYEGNDDEENDDFED